MFLNNHEGCTLNPKCHYRETKKKFTARVEKEFMLNNWSSRIKKRMKKKNLREYFIKSRFFNVIEKRKEKSFANEAAEFVFMD